MSPLTPKFGGEVNLRYNPSANSSEASDASNNFFVTPTPGLGLAGLAGGGASLAETINDTPPYTVVNAARSIEIKPLVKVTGAKSTVDADPFVVGKLRGVKKLCPTANDFKPYAMTLPAGPAVVSSPITAVQTVQAYPSSSESAATGPVSPVSDTSSSNTQMGTFSTDTGVTRAVKVTGIYGPVEIAHVEASIQTMVPKLSGDRRTVRVGSDVFIRLHNVNDAQRVYNHTRSACNEWAVNYVAPNDATKLIDGTAPFTSAHEGQVVLIAKIPGLINRRIIEEQMVELLGVDGKLYAFQKQVGQEAGIFKLLAEFCDVTCADKSIKRLHGRDIRNIKLSLTLHRPDAVPQAAPAIVAPSFVSGDARLYNPDTPTRGASAGYGAGHGNGIGNGNGSAARFNMPPPIYAGAFNRGQSGYRPNLSPTGRSFLPPANSAYGPPPAYLGPSGAPFNGHFPQMPRFGYPAPSSTNLTPPYTVGQYNPASHSHASGRYGAPGYHSPSRDSRRPEQQMTRYEGGRQQGRFWNRSGYDNGFRAQKNHASGNHNQVDIGRIHEGVDVRTTVMLRNIPNKVTDVQLKQILDETSHGLYDFSYLRIDFANNCNVGYAFINFEDPIAIVKFVNARAGQKWNKYNSDKIAEVSYATIQGKDCLVQKFRNSSVMMETPAFRPKIWYTQGHPECGKEEPFPAPDNPSKMRRSLENAEHVGLFAPRAGQQHRDDQRRRHSQYDRGTRMAQLEEFDAGVYGNFGSQFGYPPS